MQADLAREGAQGEGLTRRKSGLEGGILPASSRLLVDTELSELYLVERLGGGAKAGARRNFQAILPLRGRSSNDPGARGQGSYPTIDPHAHNRIGTGFGEDEFKLELSRYGKISSVRRRGRGHIALLLPFFQWMRELSTPGRSTRAAPLYRVWKDQRSSPASTRRRKRPESLGGNGAKSSDTRVR